MAVIGIVYPYYTAPSMTLLQEKVNTEYLGRVISVFTMLGSVAMPVGMLFFGPLADFININDILIYSGIIMIGIGSIFFLNKTLRTAGK